MSLPAPAPNRTAVVTGASSGIGKEIARELSRRGHHVTLVARRETALHQLASELKNAAVLACDLAEPGQRRTLLEKVEADGRFPAVLVNNAGFSTLGPVQRADPERELQMVEVDVAALVELCTRFLPGMVERRSGSIVNIASTAAFQPLPGQAGYGACKAFVLSYTEALHAELASTGVTATAVCPGPVETGFSEVAGFSKEDEKAMPSFMWVSADTVARAAVDGADKGKAVVIPGLANRIGAVLAHHVPNQLLLPILGKGHPGLKRD